MSKIIQKVLLVSFMVVAIIVMTVIALIPVSCTVVGFVSSIQSHFAEQEFVSGDFVWQYARVSSDSFDRTKDAYELYKYTGSDPVVTIPESYQGKPVTGIASSSFSNARDTLEQLIIPDSVTFIGQWFWRFQNLSYVRLPSGLRTIPSFSECNALRSIKLPDAAKSIDGFSDCTGLTELNLPPRLFYIGKEAFSGSTNIRVITIPSSVITVFRDAFKGWTADQTIYILGRTSIPSEWANDWTVIATQTSYFWTNL